MPVEFDDVQEGKCFTTTIKEKAAIIKVLEVVRTEVRTQTTENPGAPGQSTNVNSFRYIRWAYRFTFPPSPNWITHHELTPIRVFVSGLGKEVSCE